MNANFQRAQFLIQQSRFDLAEEQLRLVLAEESSNAVAHALLAICLNEREKFAEATEEARQAIFHAPDGSLGHYALACVMRDRNRLTEARAAIQEAIRLQPWDATSFAVLGSIEAQGGQWKLCLEAAENGLEADPEDVSCANLRSLALTNLGRREEAGQSIQEALNREPDNEFTHANEGWRQLHLRQPHKAMQHFQEALRLNPMSAWAKQGIIEAMKSRNFIYRWMLSFFLWMNGFSPKVQLALVLGFLFGQNILSAVLNAVPLLAPLGRFIGVAYLLFVWMSWSSSTLFNLVLMTNRFGRLALAPKQKIEAILAGVCVLMCLCSAAIVFLVSHGDSTILSAGLMRPLLFLGLTIPVVTAFRSEGRRRWIATIWTVGVLLVVLKCNLDAATLTHRLERTFINSFPARNRASAEKLFQPDAVDTTAEASIATVIGSDPQLESERKAVISQFQLQAKELIVEDVKWFQRGIYGIVLSTWLGAALLMIPVRK